MLKVVKIHHSSIVKMTSKLEKFHRCSGLQEPDLPCNYQPITIIPTIAHVFERMIYEHMYSFLTNNNFVSQRRPGVCCLNWTILALSDQTNEWSLSIDQGGINAVFS